MRQDCRASSSAILPTSDPDSILVRVAFEDEKRSEHGPRSATVLVDIARMAGEKPLQRRKIPMQTIKAYVGGGGGGI